MRQFWFLLIMVWASGCDVEDAESFSYGTIPVAGYWQGNLSLSESGQIKSYPVDLLFRDDKSFQLRHLNSGNGAKGNFELSKDEQKVTLQVQSSNIGLFLQSPRAMALQYKKDGGILELTNETTRFQLTQADSNQVKQLILDGHMRCFVAGLPEITLTIKSDTFWLAKKLDALTTDFYLGSLVYKGQVEGSFDHYAELTIDQSSREWQHQNRKESFALFYHAIDNKLPESIRLAVSVEADQEKTTAILPCESKRN